MKRQKITEIAATNEKTTYQPKPSLKSIVVEQATKQGYPCFTKDGVIFFIENEKTNRTKITEWLLKTFGQEEVNYHSKSPVLMIPFSYGFGTSTKDIQLTKQFEYDT